jgi:hypothetical protein
VESVAEVGTQILHPFVEPRQQDRKMIYFAIQWHILDIDLFAKLCVISFPKRFSPHALSVVSQSW